MHKIIYIIIGWIFLATACATARKAESGIIEDKPKENVRIEEIIKNNITNHGFSITRADINYNIDGVSGRLIAGIRHKNPDTMLIVLKHSTGVEFLRIYLDNDTLLINDRVNKRVMYGKPEYLGIRFGIDRETIALALGDIIVGSNNDIRSFNSLKCQKGTGRGQMRINNKEVSYEIDCAGMKIISATIIGERAGEKIRVWYSNFFREGNFVVPGRIEAEDISNKARIRMEIKGIEIPWDGQINFVPGNRYKKVMVQ